ncbi:hypothetical protein B0T11DRAFT_9127 [Plectosphaerella cucumerina]|uniref:Uncharacterized protein n=1 Tax=Plectosphaerella cucumerina TaxID=40658 RepID=A0A8K0TS61_9PEZI|nr:hypothetical protein B0T11DRAFT_9127 [Plectosphaerella cucumerina]
MNFFGRGAAAGRDAQGQTVEMGPPNLPAHVGTATEQQPSSWSFRRPNLFGGRNREEAAQPQQRPSRRGTGTNPDDSPKTPRFQFSNRPAPRLQLPWARDADGSEPHHQGQQQPPVHSERTPERRTDLDARPLPAIPQRAVTGHGDVPDGGPRRFSGPDPAEQRLAQLADDGRRRSGGRRRLRLRRVDQAAPPGGHPKRFLFCFPWVDSRRTRMLILQSFISGIFSAALLSTYLALSLTGALGTSEFSILLILIILISAAFFCHSVIRLFIYFYRPPPVENERPGVQRIGGYAVPDEPIRVILARDEEDVEEADDNPASNKPKPPPYGAWRQSIRVDPNRIYWQRNNTEEPREGPGRGPEMTGPRPPSYISEDGVDYVVEARPRSIAPTAFAPQMVEAPVPPLPVHPSEAGRWNGHNDTTWRG